MNTVYITGHQNPDIDSVCSALAYAELKNLTDGDTLYKAVRCGHLSGNTKTILTTLGITPPPYMKDVYPKVGDVILTSDENFDADDKLSELAKSFSRSNPSVTPIFKDGRFYGLVSVDNIASAYMHLLSGDESYSDPLIRDVMREEGEPIDSSMRFEEAKEKLGAFKTRGLAVFEGEEYVGYVTRRCFLNSPRYKVILVDHNEPEQSIKGLDSADIVEIIDHHRLDAPKTKLPIFIDSEPLGSTCTIVYQLYLRNGIRPDYDTAKAMLAGIIADTIILKSPTTTKIDIDSAKVLAKIVGVDYEEFGRQMFSSTERLKNREPENAIASDFKMYNEHGTKFGIGQAEVMTLADLDDYKDKYLDALKQIRDKNGLEWAVFMITDVLKEDSVLLTTDFRANQHLQYQQLSSNTYDLPGVMSRKKQLLPDIIHSLSV